MTTALPWPEPPGAERATAGPLTAEALAAEIGADLERATRPAGHRDRRGGRLRAHRAGGPAQ